MRTANDHPAYPRRRASRPRRGGGGRGGSSRPASSAAGTCLRQPGREFSPTHCLGPRRTCRPRARPARARRSRCSGRARARAAAARTMRSARPSRPSTDAAVSWTIAPARTTSSSEHRILLDVRVPLGVREHGHDPLVTQLCTRARQVERARSCTASRAAAAAGCRRARTVSARRRRADGSRSSAISPPPRTSIAIPASATAARTSVERALHLLGRRRIVVAHMRRSTDDGHPVGGHRASHLDRRGKIRRRRRRAPAAGGCGDRSRRQRTCARIGPGVAPNALINGSIAHDSIECIPWTTASGW